tara:strand:- start:297 stop:1034 length:738 start_codon:yes stop_codon:yes gene_type:complete
MKNIAIIIPARLGAERFPNKPLAKINNIPMIIHVLNKAKESKVGEVFVATPDDEILQLVRKNGGNAILTSAEHASGTDRVYEAYTKELKNNVDLIINLQGDMPNIKPSSITKLVKLMGGSGCDIGTLASYIKDEKDIMDPNVVKVKINQALSLTNFLAAEDFFRIKYDLNNKNIYHHIGCYMFTREALSRYVKLPRSKMEIERKLEQMRAMENNMIIKVSLSSSNALSVDTKEDLIKVTKEMKKS